MLGLGPCVVALTPVASSAQTPVDSKSLIGEWNGSWVDKRIPSNAGQYWLTIEKVDGPQVLGHGELTTAGGHPDEAEVMAKVAGT